MTTSDVRGGLPRDPSDDLRQRSTAELLKQLSEETSLLVRQELQLAKAEVQQKGKEAGAGAGMLGGGGVAALLTLAALTATVVALLDLAMPTWVAGLIATAIWGVVAAVLAMKGRDRLRQAGPPIPEQTIDTTKEDLAWAKTRARSASR